MGKKTIDWNKIKHDYVAGVKGEGGGVSFPSLQELARIYQCSHESIRLKSASENWPTQRKAFQDRLYDQTLDSTLEARVSTAKELDTLCNQTATLLLQQLYDLAVSEMEIEPVARTAIKYSRNALELQKMARIALGLSTEATKQESNVNVHASGFKALETRLKALSTEDLKRLVESDEEG